MCSETKNEQEDKSGRTGSGCCPENFQEMFGKMSGCCDDKGNLPDCAEIMSRMKAGCCGSESTDEKK
jgi:hypothetical protein